MTKIVSALIENGKGEYKKRVFSGIQPTGSLHLGNYFGAIKQFCALQETEECFFCIVDMHAITVHISPSDLKNYILDLAAIFLACGLNPEKSVLFAQSQISSHAELAWLLSCVARVGWLNRMVEFKEKAGSNQECASVGLYTYPVLMAADVLAYRATHVPVGEDQRQHLELMRDIAEKFNHDYNAPGFFPLPQALVVETALRIMSLRDGTVKMSKSDASDYSRINLTDDKDAIAKKIRKAKTDTDVLPENIDGFHGRPEACNLMQIQATLLGKSLGDMVSLYAGRQFSALKEDMIMALQEELVPVSTEYKKLRQDEEYLVQILSNGAERAQRASKLVLEEVYSMMGMSLRRLCK
jgi:tryptophanyl-tRNA synthetase